MDCDYGADRMRRYSRVDHDQKKEINSEKGWNGTAMISDRNHSYLTRAYYKKQKEIVVI